MTDLVSRSKASVYEAFGNPALLRAVRDHLPAGGSVLDVGCASGGLLARLGDLAGRREGIEPDAAAADAARAVADVVHLGAVDEVQPAHAAFDVVVLGDVLEHVPDPSASLTRVLAWTAPAGRVVVSLPNVAHWSMRASLLAGRWEYRDAGILDDTHLRFFTWHTGVELLADAGVRVLERRPVISGLGAHLGRRVPHRVEGVWRRLGTRRPNLFAFQQIIVAERT